MESFTSDARNGIEIKPFCYCSIGDGEKFYVEIDASYNREILKIQLTDLEQQSTHSAESDSQGIVTLADVVRDGN